MATRRRTSAKPDKAEQTDLAALLEQAAALEDLDEILAKSNDKIDRHLQNADKAIAQLRQIAAKHRVA
jgi:hypothetical protein